MPLSRKLLHDKLVLTLLSMHIFLAVVGVVFVLLRFGAEGGGDYIVQYRANLGISAFKTGDVGGIISFALFAAVITAINIVLSIRVYHIRRQLAISILGFGCLLLILTLIVSNALLGLR